MAEVLDDLKAQDIVALDLRGVADIADFFVIATVRSKAQMRGAETQILEALKAEGVKPYAPLAESGEHWSVLDYGSVVVHLFDENSRNYYRLEDLWADASQVPWRGRVGA